MHLTPIDPPRTFSVGRRQQIQIRHCATIRLEADELVTFQAPSGAEYDVVRKDWGYYATPSINSRLISHGMKTAIIRNPLGQYFVVLVERDHMKEFQAYLSDEQGVLVEWLDER